MNQILVTKKLYITPELKKKKKVYKFNFIISIFLVIALASIYVYAEYDRNRSEEVSQEILANINIPSSDDTIAKNKILIAILDNNEDNITEEIVPPVTQENNNPAATKSTEQEFKKTSSGYFYTVQSIIEIEKIGISYPVFLGKTGSEKETEELLKVSPTRFWGAEPNEVGNYCIVGHNYRNTKFFSKVPTLENGDIIKITDMKTGRKISYEVYYKRTVIPDDTSDTTQKTNGKKEVTLITCTDDSSQRVIVKAREVI